jgi:hypothetical protein
MKNIIKPLFEFLLRMRRSGTTTLLLKIAKENDVYVLVPSHDMPGYEEVKDKTVSIQQLETSQGLKGKPILIDNYTLIKYAEWANKQLDNITEEMVNRNKALYHIKNHIAQYEQYHGKLGYIQSKTLQENEQH